MLDRQQRDELVASLQGVEELWKEAAGISVVQNNIIIEILRVADDACQKGLSATRYVFYFFLFKELVDILTPQVCRICQQVSRQSQGIWAWRF